METIFILDKTIRFNPVSNELQFSKNVSFEKYEAVKVENRLSKVLQVMLDKPNEVINRSEFVGKIWEKNTNVGNPALTKAVSSLRRILKKYQPGSEHLIETIPKIGYRLKIGKATNALFINSPRFWPTVPVTINVRGAHLAILLALLFFILKLSTKGALHSAGHQLWH